VAKRDKLGHLLTLMPAQSARHRRGGGRGKGRKR
jgi:hypothetical protein